MATAPSLLRTDPVQKVLGNFGKWQLRTMLIIFMCKIPTSWFLAVIIFTAPFPDPGDYWCQPPETFPDEYLSDWIARAHPIKVDHHDRSYIDYCHVYKDFMERPLDFFGPNRTEYDATNSSIVACKNIEFKNYFSLVAEFELVCGRELLLPFSQCFHILGVLTGGIVAYIMLKYISPKRVMGIGMAAQVIFGCTLGVVKEYEYHVVFRWLTAISCALMQSSGFTIFMDITSGSAKIITSIVFELFWSIGLIVLPVFGLFIEEWCKLYIAISTPTICLIFLYRYLPDSPRWLLRNGQIEEAKGILVEGGIKNKRQIPTNLEELLKTEYSSGAVNPPQANWCSIWDGKPPKIYLFAVHYAWTVYLLLFNCVILNIRAYGKDHLSINTVAIGFSEIFGVFIGLYLVLYTRRRWLWAGAFSISCGCLGYLTWLIPETLKSSHVVALEMIPTMAIKTASSVGVCVLTVCTAELVAADRKTILMFSTQIWSRAWFLWAPFIFMLKTYDVVLPLTVFATLSVVGGLLLVIVNQNQCRVYEANNQQRLQNMAAIRTISNAGLEWVKNVRRKSAYDVENIRRKSIYETE